MDVKTDHQIVAFDDNMMMLFDNITGHVIVTAQRPNTGSPWTIHDNSGTVEDATSPDRPSAITAMTQHALDILPGVGYSTLVPHGLIETP